MSYLLGVGTSVIAMHMYWHFGHPGGPHPWRDAINDAWAPAYTFLVIAAIRDELRHRRRMAQHKPIS